MSREEAVSHDMYNSPLASRYASEYMLHLFSDDSRYQTWRRLWTALARAQHQLGLPITGEQVSQLEAHITDIDYEEAARRERQVRHDVMAHVYTYGKAAPSAAGIIHLGATSCYVTDNADLILYRDGLVYLRTQMLAVLGNLAAFAEKYAATPTLGYTHYQPAQPVTVGKRATLWMQDFLADVEELDHLLSTLRFLGCRGTTGTEASFMELFDGDEDEDRRDEPPYRGGVRLFRLLPGVRADLSPKGGQPYSRLSQRYRSKRLSHGQRHPAVCSTTARWRSRSRRSRSARPLWPTSAIPCGANGYVP